MKIASCCGASGWLSGIVGVHPWELGVCEQELQEEIWGEDPDTWVCSTYMPTGLRPPGRRGLHPQRALGLLVGL